MAEVFIHNKIFIKYGCKAINHSADTAEYIVKEFGHKALIEEAPSLMI